MPPPKKAIGSSHRWPLTSSTPAASVREGPTVRATMARMTVLTVTIVIAADRRSIALPLSSGMGIASSYRKEATAFNGTMMARKTPATPAASGV